MEKTENVKAISLEIRDTMKLEAVTIDLTKNALTVVGGKNEAGKSTVVRIFKMLSGGNKYKPSKIQSRNTENYPSGKLKLSNGLSVELKGKNSTLTVSSEHGALKSGQSLLNAFIGELALNLPKFMNSNNEDKAKILLGILGVGEELKEFNDQEKELMNDRKYYKKEYTRKESQFKGMTFCDDAPDEVKTMDSLLVRQDMIIVSNEDNAKIKNEYNSFVDKIRHDEYRLQETEEEIKELITQINELKIRELAQAKELNTNKEKQDKKLKQVNQLKDIPLEPIKQEMQQLESENNKFRENQKYTTAQTDLAKSVKQVNKFTTDLDKIRASRKALLDNAKLPLDGLSIEDGELVYNGDKWDCMSTSSQLKVSVAIIKALYPKCGFVLLDDLSNFDTEQLQLFGEWLVTQDLQVIGTRVSSGDECTLIIKDGKGTNIKE